MGHLSSMFNGLARSFSIKKGRSPGRCGGREAAQAMAKEAKKNDLLLCSSGTVNADDSNNFASVFSKRGQKGVNQDCCIVWEEFGCQEDMIFCGIFDGHGPWGHFVAKRVRESMPPSLLCNWQETLAQTSLDPEIDIEEEKRQQRFNIWKHSYLKTCAAIDQELQQHRKIDSFYSGTTALSIVRQGELIIIANVGDSRAVLATRSDDGSLVPVQLTVDFKPNLPQEAERIIQCQGRVFCLHDEPGVHRVWLPDEESPGLAMSRAFGDYCIKEYGLISVPEVTHRNICSKDQFVVLATDGVWDVISNQEAVDIVSSTPDKAKSAKRLVECAVLAWKRKRRGIAMDDISAICLFFHSCSPQQEFGCQEDMIFCGIFDGHGPWGHFVAKRVRESMPPSLLCNWQETLAQTLLDPEIDIEEEKRQQRFNIWKHSYLKTCAAIDQELEQHRKIDSFYSGTTALSIVRQGELIIIANVGDSRAVLATTSDDGSLVPVQLTVDFKPNLPQEAERIIQCQGRVFCLHDEPGVHRVWLPDEESPGLAMSRAFGDYCIKEYGLISVPEVTHRNICSNDQFVVLATDGVWDVISNQEAVDIVSSTPDKAKSAKRLVECAVLAWKRKRRGIAMDDISAICLFFHSCSPQQVTQLATLK